MTLRGRRVGRMSGDFLHVRDAEIVPTGEVELSRSVPSLLP
jgi:hypothetical protein